jgi:hypothetical protein
MKDLKDARVIWIKGGLFLGIGVAAALLLLVEKPSLKVAFLLGLSVWGFCRAYYFAFYVIQYYLDPAYRFSGLGSFIRYAWNRRPRRP